MSDQPEGHKPRRHSTGELLTNPGNRIGQPARQSSPPRRRPLLTTQAATAAVQAAPPGPEAPPLAVLALLGKLAAWDVTAIERAREMARYAVAIATALPPLSTYHGSATRPSSATSG